MRQASCLTTNLQPLAATSSRHPGTHLFGTLLLGKPLLSTTGTARNAPTRAAGCDGAETAANHARNRTHVPKTLFRRFDSRSYTHASRVCRVLALCSVLGVGVPYRTCTVCTLYGRAVANTATTTDVCLPWLCRHLRTVERDTRQRYNIILQPSMRSLYFSISAGA